MKRHFEGYGKTRSKVPEDMLFFEGPEQNIGQYNAYEQYFEPTNLVEPTSGESIEFDIPPQKDFLNLRSVELYMDFCVKKKKGLTWSDGNISLTGETETLEDGTTFPAAFATNDEVETVVPIDAFLQTQWSDVSLTLGEQTVCSSNHDFPHKTYIDLLLRTKMSEMDKLTESMLFTKSFCRKRQEHPSPYRTKDSGGIKRSRRVRGGHLVQLSGPLLLDFFKNPKRLLVNGVRLKLRLTPATDKFRFVASSDTVSEMLDYQIRSIKLKCMYIEMNPNSVEGVVAVQSENNPIPYQFVRSELHSFQLKAGRSDFKVSHIFSDQLPIDMVVVMVDTDALYGNWKMDPFFFKRNHIESAVFEFRGKSIPGKPLNFRAFPRAATEMPDPEKEVIPFIQELQETKANEWQLRPLQSIWEVSGTTENGFTRNTLKDGDFVIAFKTDPTVPANVPYWGTPKTGSTKLEMFFAKPIETEQQVLVLARFPALVTIDNKRNVTVLN